VGGFQKTINALIAELRSWPDDEAQLTVYELSQRFGLEAFVIQQIARSEDVDLKFSRPQDSDVDPNETTIDLDPEEVDEALKKRDPNPDWKDKDEVSGVWESGRFKRIDDDDES